LTVRANVKITMQCFKIFGGQMPPLVTRLNRSMPNFKLWKCDETDLKEYLPDITQSI